MQLGQTKTSAGETSSSHLMQISTKVTVANRASVSHEVSSPAPSGGIAVEKKRISIMPIPVATIGVPVYLLTRPNTGWRFPCSARPTCDHYYRTRDDAVQRRDDGARAQTVRILSMGGLKATSHRMKLIRPTSL